MLFVKHVFKFDYIYLIAAIILLVNVGCVVNDKAIKHQSKQLRKSIEISLPESAEWKKVTDKKTARGYTREWVPKGSTGENAEWIVVEQKFVQKSPISAMEFTGGMYAIAKNMCEDVKYLKPVSNSVKGYDSVLGWVICSRQKGLNYGTFTHQRVITDKNVVYVVTSELRMPPTKKAGMFAFQKAERHKMKPFLARVKKSKLFVQNAVDVCVADGNSCSK